MFIVSVRVGVNLEKQKGRRTMPKISKYIYEELVNQIDADINSAQSELSNIIRDAINKKANSWLKANEEGIRDSISINIDTSSVGYYNRPNTRITVRLDNSWNSDLDKSINKEIFQTISQSSHESSIQDLCIKCVMPKSNIPYILLIILTVLVVIMLIARRNCFFSDRCK